MGKLRRVLNFLNKKKGGDCVIGYDNIYYILTYVDDSYATHNDMRGHNGGCMTFGWGLIHAKSSNQNLNTKISTESKVVRDSDYIPFIILLVVYMEHQ